MNQNRRAHDTDAASRNSNLTVFDFVKVKHSGRSATNFAAAQCHSRAIALKSQRL
jgi:hypothetical protein